MGGPSSPDRPLAPSARDSTSRDAGCGHEQKDSSPVLGTPRRSIWGSPTGWTGKKRDQRTGSPWTVVGPGSLCTTSKATVPLPACLPACMRLGNSLKFLESPSSVQCSVQCSVLCPSGGTPEGVPRPGVLGRVCTTSTGPMGGREPAVEGRATRLGLRREDESRMRPLQRLRRPWGRQEGNAREHKTRCAGKGLGQGLRPNHLDYATR